MMRIGIGGISQESNSFSPVAGSWDHFGPGGLLGQDQIVRQSRGTNTEAAGALDVAERQGQEIVPLFLARSSASAGPMRGDVFHSLQEELLQSLRRNVTLDGLLLILHGALVAEGCEDASGQILSACRNVLGPNVPIATTLDLHANVTQSMALHSNLLVGYHTAPHVDMAETGQRAMKLLLRLLTEEGEPKMAIRRLPMILPAENGQTTTGPLAEVMALGRKLREESDTLDFSIFSVQPWLDVSDVGCSVVVIAREREVAENQADLLADYFWSRRHDFDVSLEPLAEAVEAALQSRRNPVVLADSADSPSSGAPGDSTSVLQAILAATPSRDCYLNIVDPPGVQQIMAAGVGKDLELELGARFATDFYSPIRVKGRVKLISDGEFVPRGPGFRGVIFSRGNTAVLQVGHVFIVVMERPVFQWDPEFYRSVGLDPRDAQIVVVKSPAGFRAAYSEFAGEIRIVDTPGVCSPRLRSLPFRHVRRPLYPLDEFENWRTASAGGFALE